MLLWIILIVRAEVFSRLCTLGSLSAIVSNLKVIETHFINNLILISYNYLIGINFPDVMIGLSTIPVNGAIVVVVDAVAWKTAWNVLHTDLTKDPVLLGVIIGQFFLIHFNRFGLFTFVISIVSGPDMKILTDSKVKNSRTRISRWGSLKPI